MYLCGVSIVYATPIDLKNGIKYEEQEICYGTSVPTLQYCLWAFLTLTVTLTTNPSINTDP